MGCLFFLVGLMYGCCAVGGLIIAFLNPVEGLAIMVVCLALLWSCIQIGAALDSGYGISTSFAVLLSIGVIGFIIVSAAALSDKSTPQQLCYDPNNVCTVDIPARVFGLIGAAAHVVGMVGAAISTRNQD